MRNVQVLATLQRCQTQASSLTRPGNYHIWGPPVAEPIP